MPTREQESCALDALRAIVRGDVAEDDPRRARLQEYLRLNKDQEVNALVRRLTGRSSGRVRFRVPWYGRVIGHAPSRRLLLFVLLAHVEAAISRFGVFAVLERLRLLTPEAKGDLLSAVSCWLPRRRGARLEQRYLEEGGPLFFPEDAVGGGLSGATGFKNYPCLRQLAALLSRRQSESIRQLGGNPACHAETLEFRLAHDGAFGEIERRGGFLAKTVLEDLKYHDGRDAIRPAKRFRVWGIVGAAVFFGLAILFVSLRSNAWERDNQRLIEDAQRLRQEVGPARSGDSCLNEHPLAGPR